MKILKQKRRKKYEPNPNQVITAETQALWDASVSDLRVMLTMQNIRLARVTERKRPHWTMRTFQGFNRSPPIRSLIELQRKIRARLWLAERQGMTNMPGYTKAKRSIRRKTKRIQQELARRAA